jgi:hypothetical protein
MSFIHDRKQINYIVIEEHKGYLSFKCTCIKKNEDEDVEFSSLAKKRSINSFHV